MPADGIGRLLVASLHQSIAEVLPLRLGFYEHWLNESGLRVGSIGLPPFLAVLSFLRQEGDAYDKVTARAGQHAADWMVESMPALQRSAIRAMPTWLQARLVVRLVGRLAQTTYRGSRTVWSLRRGVARIHVSQSVFCTVREPVAQPLCTFYAAACSRVLAHFGFKAHADIVACRGAGQSSCELVVRVANQAADAGEVQVSPS